MIIPRFSLSQDETFLIINIRAPYCNIKELEIYVEKNDFRFSCAPYYLRLNLPGNIIDNDDCTGNFDTETGEFLLKYIKENKGETFEGLDFITSLLTPIKQKQREATIEVLSETTNPETTKDNTENDWHIQQNIPEEPLELINTIKYGFANKKSSVLKDIEEVFYSVFDIRNVDITPIQDRKLLRFQLELDDFNSDHYVADYFDDSQIKQIIKSYSPWEHINKNKIAFTDKERDILKDFPNKEYLLKPEEIKTVLYSFIDILFAFSYDKRTTDFESNCESGWTITKLSSTLSWFDEFNNLKDVIKSNFRRSLIYPLYRNFELSQQVFKDLKTLINLGSIKIVRSLIEIYNILNSSADPRHILNDLYIKDYIIFIQKCPKEILNDVINELQNITIVEDDLELNLKQIIHDQINEKNAGNSILEKMAKLNLTRIKSDSESEDTETETETSDSDSGSYEETSDSDDESE